MVHVAVAHRAAFYILFEVCVFFRVILRLILGRQGRQRYFQVNDLFHRTELFMCKILSPFKTGAMGILTCSIDRSIWSGKEPRVKEKIESMGGRIFVDVGADIGLYSVLASQRFEKVISVEPYPSTRRHLERMIYRSGIRNILVVPAAISNISGTIPLYLSPDPRSNSVIRTWRSGDSSIHVKAMTLDELLRNETSVDLVKIDVESAEITVLEGAVQSMDKVKSWIIEVHKTGFAPLIKSMLEAKGCKTHWLDHNHLFADNSSACEN